MSNDWKDLLADKFADALAHADETSPTDVEQPKHPTTQALRVETDKKGRKGKTVTLVTRFHGDGAELERLMRLLQKGVGAGGSCCFDSEPPYDGQILIQGDCRDKVKRLLEAEGYKTK